MYTEIIVELCNFNPTNCNMYVTTIIVLINIFYIIVIKKKKNLEIFIKADFVTT